MWCFLFKFININYWYFDCNKYFPSFLNWRKWLELFITKDCDTYLFVIIIIIIIIFIFKNDLFIQILTYKFVLYYFTRRLITEMKKKT